MKAERKSGTPLFIKDFRYAFPHNSPKQILILSECHQSLNMSKKEELRASLFLKNLVKNKKSVLKQLTIIRLYAKICKNLNRLQPKHKKYEAIKEGKWLAAE